MAHTIPHAELGERIKRARVNAGLFQHELAEAVGVKKPTISRWETGTLAPHPVRLPRIARACGTTVDALLGKDAA